MSQYHVLTTQYMMRFRCLGGDCEDTCCRDWNVYVDDEAYHALQERLEDPVDRAAVAKLEGGSQGRYALMVLREPDRFCHFFDENRLCSIHARYGEDLLPERCATYPRIRRRVFDRVEVVGSMSCPEMVRQVLLHDDALRRIPGEPDLVGRGWLRREIPDQTTDPYEANFLAVRSAAMALLSQESFPIASRLFFLAFFAAATRSYLRRDAESFDVDGLQQLAVTLQSAENLASLEKQLPRIEGSDRFALSMTSEFIRVGLSYVPVRELLLPILAFFAERARPVDGEDESTAFVRSVRGLPPLPAELGARLDVLAGRYAAHELLRSWYVEETSFVSYVHQLLARTAFIRFVVRVHATISPPADVAAFDALVVRVVYLIARMVEGIDKVSSELASVIEATGMPIEAAVSLIRV